MVLIDSTVWIDFFNGIKNQQTDSMSDLLENNLIYLADIVILEVLQGIRDDKLFEEIKILFGNCIILNVLNTEYAIKSANNFRYLRKKGITIRKSIDCLIATYCIENSIKLLHIDKDFQPFVEYLGLKII